MGGARLSLKQETISDWIAAFIFDRKVGNVSPGTIDYYRVKLSKFLAYCDREGIHQVERITPDDLRRFLAWLDDQGHNSGGKHAFYRAVKTFTRWYEGEAEPEGWKNPIRKVKAPKVEQVILEPADPESIAAMVATCKGKSFTDLRDKAIILTLLDTGLRAAELLNLDLGDIDLIMGETIVKSGKGRKPRTVFVGKRTRRALRAYTAVRESTDQALFVSDDAERLTYWGLRSMIKRRAAGAGVAAPSLHSFRRAFALAMLRAGVDLITLQKLMGHSDLSVLSRYLAQVTGDLRIAHDRASPVDTLQ